MAKRPPPKGAVDALDDDNPFTSTADASVGGTPVPPPKPVDAQALVAQLTQLQKDVQAADRERATAAAQLAQAQKDLKEIDDRLTSLGVDPETAPAALTQLEQELAALAATFEQSVATERAVYQKIAASLA